MSQWPWTQGLSGFGTQSQGPHVYHGTEAIGDAHVVQSDISNEILVASFI